MLWTSQAATGVGLSKCSTAVPLVSWSDLGRLVLPALCSVASMVVQGLGLQYISASTSLVLSGSAILFTAALSTLLLRCRLNSMHCLGESVFSVPLAASTACRACSEHTVLPHCKAVVSGQSLQADCCCMALVAHWMIQHACPAERPRPDAQCFGMSNGQWSNCGCITLAAPATAQQMSAWRSPGGANATVTAAAAGIALVLAGTCVVACANVLWPPPALRPQAGGGAGPLPHRPAAPLLHGGQSLDKTALGVGLTLLSMLLLAGRLVAEEVLLTSTRLHPLQACRRCGL